MIQIPRHLPRKRFGQHFLHDPAVISRIISVINAQADDLVVEIGPGQGALTDPLLTQVNVLHLIELDRDLAAALKNRLPADRCKIYPQDALKFDFSRITNSPNSLRIIGNLPYNISTPLIFHILEQHKLIRDMHFMLQKEVVARMSAAPGSKDYGRLSVMLQLHCHCEPLFNVGPGAFSPAPKVDSTIVRLIPHQSTPIETKALKTLDSLLKQMFSKRRKTIRNSLSGLLNEDDIECCEINPGQRPEQLSIEQFIRLARRLGEAQNHTKSRDKDE